MPWGLEQHAVEHLVQHEPGDRIAEVAVRLFEQQYVPELVLGAQEREVVLVATGALQLGCIAVEHARLADVIQRAVRVGEFFLEFRAGGDEFDHTLADDQRVVTEPGNVRQQCLVAVHRFSTPSGIS